MSDTWYLERMLAEMERDEQKRAKFARRVYDVLVEQAGASESMRLNFVLVWDSIRAEYRFQGSLGFGGKFRRQGGRMYVDCYPEDMTPEREAIIQRTNEALAALQQEQA